MYERWQALMAQYHFSYHEPVYQALQAAYSESHRHYHCASHIDATLLHLDSVHVQANNPNEIELALWFHDAIYKPFSSSNELDSANWAADFLATNDAAQREIDRVHRLIMVTRHDTAAETADEKLMVDIDLTILGSHPDHYQQFEINVRKEYQWVPQFLYRKKRREVLRSFLGRERIYNSDYFYARFEQQARINLVAAIDLL